MNLAWLFAAVLLVGMGGCLAAVWYGCRHWGRWEGRAIIAIALVILWCLAAATAVLMPVDLYVHDTYVTLRPR